MMRHAFVLAATTAAATDRMMMTGPSGVGPGTVGPAAFMSVSPAGNAAHERCPAPRVASS